MSLAQSYDGKQGTDFKDGVQKLGDRAVEVKDSFTGLAHDASSTAKAAVQEASKGVRETVDAGKKTAAQAIEGITDRISENPLTTIGVALGVGIIIGLFVRRSRS